LIENELNDGEGKTLILVDPDGPGLPGVRLMIESIPEMLVLLKGVLPGAFG